jgi:N-acetylglucosaminyldiphosphoundecaprenol N-acetyl-beta-D-mannosaminyltransferase
MVHKNMRNHREAVSFLGICVHPMTIAELTAQVRDHVLEGGRCVIAHHNLHSLYLYHREAKLRVFFRDAEWTHIDGMPLVALARLYGYRVHRCQRVTYVDWMRPLMASAAANQWRVFYLGSAPGIAERGAAILRQRFAGLQIRTMHGYFNADPWGKENQEIVDLISAYKPHLLMVGMGMPRQECWIHDNLTRLCANVILPSGAAIDYVAGAIYTPPRWAGRAGLEWAFRLATEPKRLWTRYLVEPWSLLGMIARDFIDRRVQSLVARI